MSAIRTTTGTLLACACWLALSANASAQETLMLAKDLYASAAYDEALAVFDRLNDKVETDDPFEIAGYRIFCLLALGRNDEARREIQVIVRTNPLYRLSSTQASPRTRALFDEERRRMLPEILQQTYASAKAALDRKDMAAALTGFDRVASLVQDPGLADQPGLEDMRTLATGFRDLIRLSMATAAPPAAPPAAAAPAPREPPTYGIDDSSVAAPVVINQAMPPWHPPSTAGGWREYRGTLEIVIDETGKVIAAALRKGLHPSYDSALIGAAKRWKFQPATKDGAPVRYRKVIEVVLHPTKPEGST